MHSQDSIVSSLCVCALQWRTSSVGLHSIDWECCQIELTAKPVIGSLVRQERDPLLVDSDVV